MTNNMPRTPLSTPLSGSAREAELRLRNIFSGPKKRPPVLFLAAMFSVCLLCGNLVSCQMAQAEEEPPPASVAVDPSASLPEEQTQDWTPVELRNTITPDCLVDEPYAGFTREEIALLGDLDMPDDVTKQLPRQAVDPHRARRQDYWHDMLLPVAYDEEEDVTVYFVVVPGSMPDLEPGAGPDLYALEQRGIVVRWRDYAAYFDFSWDINAKLSAPPLLCVNDFDGDSRPEAAVALTWGEGTGCYVQSLYIIELDYGAMSYSTPDYSSLPLEITASPDKHTARLVSGEKEWEVDLFAFQLSDRFTGCSEVGNIVRFLQEDGRVLCELDVDLTYDTLGYFASGRFPVIYEDGVYKLGPAESLGDVL